MRKYYLEEIEHTADFGIKLWANDQKILFEKCAEAFENAMIDLKNVEPVIEKNLEIYGESREELLLNLLRELLFIFDTEGFVFKKVDIEIKEDKRLVLKGKGEYYNSEKHKKKFNIKAITYHNFYLKEKEKGFETQIIFDV